MEPKISQMPADYTAHSPLPNTFLIVIGAKASLKDSGGSQIHSDNHSKLFIKKMYILVFFLLIMNFNTASYLVAIQWANAVLA